MRRASRIAVAARRIGGTRRLPRAHGRSPCSRGHARATFAASQFTLAPRALARRHAALGGMQALCFMPRIIAPGSENHRKTLIRNGITSFR